MSEIDLYAEIEKSNNIRSGDQEYEQSWDGTKSTIGYPTTFFDDVVDVAGDIVEGAGDFAVGVAKGLPGGASKAGMEIADTLTGQWYSTVAVPWMNENIPGVKAINESVNKTIKPEGTAQEIGAMIGEVGTQIVAPGAVATKALQGANIGSRFLTNVLGYGATEAIVIPAKDKGLIESAVSFLAQDSEATKALLETLEADEDLPYLLQKLQRTPLLMLEGGVIGESISEGLGALIKYGKNSPMLTSLKTGIKSKFQQIGENAQTRLDQDTGGASLSALGGGEIDKVIDKGLSKLAPKRVGTTGQYIGGPQGINSPQKLGSLRTKVRLLAQEGKSGRFWYERSGKYILDAVGGDVDEADKIIQAIAVTSPGTPVKSNFDYAIQAYSQFKAGNPIRTGRFPEAMSKRLEQIFKGEDWGGRKTDDFYNNLMIHIDPSRAGPVTGDIWMLRAFGYKTDMPSEQQYKFITRETQKIADELGWQPHQVQASIWVATKARDEGIDLSKAGFDYANALNDNLGQISWESIPGATGNHLKEMFTSPYNVQVDYHVDISKAFLDKDGNDIIAKKLGIMTPGDFEAPGYFEGKVSPGTQTEFVAPRQYKGPKYGKVDPSTEQLINAYSATRGILMKQDGVGWHRPWFNPTKKDANGMELDIGRQFSEGEIKQLADILRELSGHSDYNPISTKTGVRIINFDFLEFDNKEFTKLMENAISKLKLDDDAGVRAGQFHSQNGYVGNDWSVNKNGEAYINAISREGSSDLSRRVRDIIKEIQPRIDDIDKDYSEKYGFTRNEELNKEYRTDKQSGADDTPGLGGDQDG